MTGLRTARYVVLPVVVVLLSALLPADLAAAAGRWPTKPTSIRVASVGHTSFTVVSKRSKNARTYRLFVSTLKSDVFYDNIINKRYSAARKIFASRTPRVVAKGLRYRTVPYYFRLATFNGPRHGYGLDIGSLGLRPTAPTDLRVSTAGGGAYVTWRSGAASGARITWATSLDLKQNRVTRNIRGTTHVYTPAGMEAGRRYYVTVRALNQTTASAAPPAAAMSTNRRAQAVKVMTYNILHLEQDGDERPGGVVARWADRRTAAANLITGVNPDVLAVQEANQWVGASPGVRQVDSLAAALDDAGASYRVAETAGPYSRSRFNRADAYILYQPSRYRAVGEGGNFAIGTDSWAAYQALRNRDSGATFMAVSTHLSAGRGRSYDGVRQAETTRLIARAKTVARGLPIVYAGDFNSDDYIPNYTFDGPALAMQAAGVNDSRQVATRHRNEKYNSMNEYRRVPSASAKHIDYIWLAPGVAVTSWGSALHLSGGRYVGTIPSDHNPDYATVIIRY